MNNAPLFMVAAEKHTITLHYGEKEHKFHFAFGIVLGETKVERLGNAIRISWKTDNTDQWGAWDGVFEIAIDDIGFPGGRLWELEL